MQNDEDYTQNFILLNFERVLSLEYCSDSRNTHIAGKLLKLAFQRYPFFIFYVTKWRCFGMAKTIPEYTWIYLNIPNPSLHLNEALEREM